MNSLWPVLRAGLRLRWRPLLTLSLLLGVIGGVVLGAAAGARRTDTAYPRLLAWADAAQIRVLPTAGPGYGYAGYFRDLGRLPQVATMSTTSLYNMILPHSRRRQVEAMSSPDGRTGLAVDRVKVISGRPFGPDSAGQAMVDEQTAAREHLRPGSVLHVLAVPYSKRTGNPDEAHGIPLTFLVSAIVVFDSQIVPGTGTSKLPTVMLSPSFSTPHNEISYGYGTTADIRLKPGASTTAFLRSARQLATKHPRTAPIDVITLAGQVAATEGAIRPVAVAMALFAALAAIIGLAIISQLVSRQLMLDSAEFPIMRAVGMTRRQLLAVALARIGLLTLASAVLAIVIAVAASPLLPVGPAAAAEPRPGVAINLAILGAGFALIVLLPALLALPVAWAVTGQGAGPEGVAQFDQGSSPGLGSRLGLAGSLPGVIGTRMALEPGRGRTAVPVRSALTGTVLAVTALVAALVFGASMARLVGSPARYGQRWQLEMNFGFGGLTRGIVARVIAHEPGVAGYAAGDYGQVRVGGTVIAAIGVDQVRGHGYLTVLAGRPPRAGGQIVLGAKTLHALHKRIGDSITVLVNGRARTVRIVGEGVFASFSRGAFAATDLGNGAATTASFLSTPSPHTGCSGGPCYNFLLVRFRPGTDLQVAREHLIGVGRALGCPAGSCIVTPDQRPTDIRNYASVRDTPMLLGGVLVLLAIGTLTHVLVTGVRRRRRDLSMLKTLGMLRRQVLATVLWQATALASVALIIGVPLGIVVGRQVWALFAGSVGVAPDPDVPVTGMLVILVAALLVANLVAVLPGWTAARIRPASTLRGE